MVSCNVDYAGPISGKMFLIAVDAYSKWPEIMEMTSTTSTATLNQLRRIFAQFGYPQALVTDNGTQFTSKTSANFAQKMESSTSVLPIPSPIKRPSRKIRGYLQENLTKAQRGGNYSGGHPNLPVQLSTNTVHFSPRRTITR